MTVAYPIIPGVAFKPIDGFPDYCVGDDGTVWSRHAWRRPRIGSIEWRKLEFAPTKKGYYSLRLCASGMRRRVFVHVLVLEVFVGPRPEGMEACHFPDPNKNNNRLGNLVWGTQETNSYHRILQDTMPPAHPLSANRRLAVSQVAEIRNLYGRGVKRVTLARKYGVTPDTIWQVVTRRSWRHIA